ncbi:MAG: DUF1501 domain-containing protein [Ilumatobacter sp.]|uniref:DUF1501 domain-containing protein n=1 Tax=Ilumatobacter sp. TaxID=1967498 RepID=UPI00261D28D2|nr:DUF1501 domain-containing protein [Ilumatobacter sp.]MDJ0769367.1 DUF1501 domain-containing protein [Ilumatobacter sp.]
MLDSDISTADALRHLHQAETDPHALDRRRFLQLLGMGAGAGVLAGPTGALLEQLVPGHDPLAWAAGPVGPTDGILVVIGMYGGNDGLNTIVPFNDPLYYEQHGALAIPGNQTLALDGNVGLNPALTELKQFWDDGQLAIVDGIGYPNGDLSHFNSMAYWMAGRPHAIPTSGWLGRWLDGYLSGSKDLYAAAEIGSSVPLHLVGNAARGTVVPPYKPGFGADTDERSQRQYQVIRDMRSASQGPWFEAIGDTFVDTLDLARTLSPVIPEDQDLPDTDIVAGLEIAARLINANLGFRVLTAGWGDFDSHAGQPDQHPLRMDELNAAVRRFFQLLDPAWLSRVTVMTFSEFGRTPWDNDGAGTDHGTAAPHFVFGQNVKGGRYGQQPTLAGLQRWDRVEHHVDFRSYYASIIDGWLGGGSSDVLGGNYENLGLFSRGPGRNLDGSPAPGPAVISSASDFVPMTPFRVIDTRNGHGGVAARALRPEERVRVRVRGVNGVPAGATAVVANVTAVGATSPMFFTVYPGGTARPNTSNINGGPGRPVPNLVVMNIGDDGHIEVYNSHGSTHCLVDVFGYFVEGGGDRFVAVNPSRLFDTREGSGVRRGKLAHDQPIDIQVSGRAGVPSSGASAVVLNLTATQPESPGFLRVTPTGDRRAETSNVNFFANDTVPNLVVAKLGKGGKITLDSAGQGVHALADVFGYFTKSGGRLRAMPPRRLLDTRDGTGADRGPIGPRRTLRLPIGGRESVPESATAVVLNVTATNVAAASFVTVWPEGEDQPGTSNLNLIPGQTIANLVVCRLGEGGALAIGNQLADCDVIADVLGYFID